MFFPGDLVFTGEPVAQVLVEVADPNLALDILVLLAEFCMLDP